MIAAAPRFVLKFSRIMHVNANVNVYSILAAFAAFVTCTGASLRCHPSRVHLPTAHPSTSSMKLFAAIVACLVLLSSASVEARGKDPKDCEGAEFAASWRRVMECLCAECRIVGSKRAAWQCHTYRKALSSRFQLSAYVG